MAKSINLKDFIESISYNKSQTYNKVETNEEINKFQFIEIVSGNVEDLDSSLIKTNKIYLEVNDENIERNRYDLYIYVNNEWEQIDSLEFDVGNYYNKAEITSFLSDKADSVHGHDVVTSTVDGFMSIEDKNKLDSIEWEANKIIVDTALSTTSTNPVQNKLIKTELDKKAPKSHKSTTTTYGLSSDSYYGHAKASSTQPLMNDENANVGVEVSTFARGDHVHPIDSSRASNDHVHGNISNDGKIEVISGSVKNVVVTDSEDNVTSVGTLGSNNIADGSINADKLADNSVTSAKIVNGAIVNEDIADKTITGGKLVNSAITATQLANNSVTTAKIKDGNVTLAKLNSDVYDTTDGGTENSNKLVTSGVVYSGLSTKANSSDVYTKSETLTTGEITQAIVNAVSNVELFELKSTLPTSNIKGNKFYLIPNNETINNNVYDIYIYVNNKWEQIDSLEFDITDYPTEDEVNGKLDNYVPILQGTASRNLVTGADKRVTLEAKNNHAHGNITSTGKIGSESGKPIITTTGGTLTTGAFGTSAGQFAEGNHNHDEIYINDDVGTVTSSNIVNGTIVNDDIANDTIQLGKLNSNVYDNTNGGSSGSSKLITSGAVYNGLSTKANSSDVYTKNETLTTSEITQLVSNAITNVELFELKQTLPTSKIKSNKFYLIPNMKNITRNIYDVYIYVNNDWERIDSLEFDITDYPTTATVTGMLESALVSYYTKSEIENINGEYIEGTQSASTNVWTGTSTKLTDLHKGTVIYYKLPYASTNTNVTLNLTLKNGSLTGAKNVYYEGTTFVKQQYPVNSVIGLVYDGSDWRVISRYTNTNYYERLSQTSQIIAGESLPLYSIVGGSDDGLYYVIKSGLDLDVRYPILYMNTNVNENGYSGNVYQVLSGVNIQNTVSGKTVTVNKQVYIEGVLDKNIFTVSNNVFVSDDNLTDGKYYIPIGASYSTIQLRFNTLSQNILHYEEDNGLIPIGGSYGDLFKNLSSNQNVVTDSNGVITTEPKIVVDNALTVGGANPVSGGAIKDYIDDAVGDVVSGNIDLSATHDHDDRYIKSGTGTVTSTNILNGTIVNDDIADSTIQLGKLNSNVYDTTNGGSNGSNKLITSGAVYTKLNPIVKRYDGVYVAQSATQETPFYRLFHIQSKNGSSSSSRIIFEIMSHLGTSYVRIAVYLRQNTNVIDSTFSYEVIDAVNFNLDEIYFGINKTYPNTSVDIFRKVLGTNYFIVKVYDDHLRDGTYTQYSPEAGGTETYESVGDASSVLYGEDYDEIIQATYVHSADKFVVKGGGSNKLLLANGDLKSVSDFANDIHNQATTTITNSENYGNLGSNLTNQKLINDAINTKIGALTNVELITLVTGNLPTASASTMNKLYVKTKTGGTTNDNYDIYVTVKNGNNYAWEKIDDFDLQTLSIDWESVTGKPLKFPPSAHTDSTASNVGQATGSLFGHVKLSDNYKSSGGNASQGVGASSKAVYDTYTEFSSSSKTTKNAHTHNKLDISDFGHTHSKSEITDFTHTHYSLEKTGAIGADGDLNNVISTGWYSYSTVNSNSILNVPIKGKGAVFEVIDDYGGGVYVVQKLYTLPSNPDLLDCYYRVKYANSWSEWKKSSFISEDERAYFPSTIHADNVIDKFYLSDDLQFYAQVGSYYRSYTDSGEMVGDLQFYTRNNYIPNLQIVEGTGLKISSESGEKGFQFPVVNPKEFQFTYVSGVLRGWNINYPKTRDSSVIYGDVVNAKWGIQYGGDSTTRTSVTDVAVVSGDIIKIVLDDVNIYLYKNNTLLITKELGDVLEGIDEYFFGFYTNVDRNLIIKDVIIK